MMQNKEDAILSLQKKLYGAPTAIQHIIFEAIWRLNSNQDVEGVLNWFNKVESAYYDIKTND